MHVHWFCTPATIDVWSVKDTQEQTINGGTESYNVEQFHAFIGLTNTPIVVCRVGLKGQNDSIENCAHEVTNADNTDIKVDKTWIAF